MAVFRLSTREIQAARLKALEIAPTPKFAFVRDHCSEGSAHHPESFGVAGLHRQVHLGDGVATVTGNDQPMLLGSTALRRWSARAPDRECAVRQIDPLCDDRRMDSEMHPDIQDPVMAVLAQNHW
jgi:hypothetical protein